MGVAAVFAPSRSAPLRLKSCGHPVIEIALMKQESVPAIVAGDREKRVELRRRLFVKRGMGAKFSCHVGDDIVDAKFVAIAEVAAVDRPAFRRQILCKFWK
jgi:hypothetical protein